MGTSKIDIPLKKKEEKTAVVESKPVVAAAPSVSGPTISKCTVDENGKIRTFTVTIEPIGNGGNSKPKSAEKSNGKSEPIFSTFNGIVDVVDILVKEGDHIDKGTVVAKIEAMKATHDIKSPKAGLVEKINVKIGDEVDSSNPIMTIS